jgi:DNA-binding transcriptional ArsR family regulator
MRYFIFTSKGNGTKKNPYYVSVYEITNPEEVKLCGYKEFNPNATRGEISEAYAVLYENGIVPEEEYKESNGYYKISNTKVKIHFEL